MAIDTADKRMSLLGLALPVPMVAPAPDGSIDLEDRLQWLWLYRSIAPSKAVLAVSVYWPDRDIDSYWNDRNIRVGFESDV